MSEERNLFGVRVVSSAFVPEGEAYMIGDFPKPPEWDAMTDLERIRYAVANGQFVVVRNLYHVHATVQQILQDTGR